MPEKKFVPGTRKRKAPKLTREQRRERRKHRKAMAVAVQAVQAPVLVQTTVAHPKARVENPYVARCMIAPNGGSIAIVLRRADANVFAIVIRDHPMRVRKQRMDHFDEEYKPFQYDVRVAAASILHGLGPCGSITDVAHAALTSIVNGKELQMSEITGAQTEMELGKGGSAVAPAKGNGKAPGKVGAKAKGKGPTKAPAAKAATPTPKASGKGPAKAQNAPAKVAKAGKAGAGTAKGAKTAAKAPAKARNGGAKAAGKAKAGKGTAAGTRARLDGTKVIKVLAENNPRREGSAGHTNWNVIKRYNGKTVEAYLGAGGGSNHLNWDVAHGNVKLV